MSTRYKARVTPPRPRSRPASVPPSPERLPPLSMEIQGAPLRALVRSADVDVTDYAGLVEQLAIDHRARAAKRELMRAGPSCTPALREGLRHPDPMVRKRSADVLDHFLDADALPELIANLDHEDFRVRRAAMHALACERCKEGSCRPGEDETVPIALDRLANDPNRYVRKSAVELLGEVVHRRRDVLEALQRTAASDPDPMVRKCAGWRCPGGPIFERTKPKPARKPRSA